jgi:hypothetical protein
VGQNPLRHSKSLFFQSGTYIVNELNSWMASGWMMAGRPLAAAGAFPAAAAAVSVVGILVAVSVGLYTVKKAREVNAASVDLRSLPGEDE